MGSHISCGLIKRVWSTFCTCAFDVRAFPPLLTILHLPTALCCGSTSLRLLLQLPAMAPLESTCLYITVPWLHLTPLVFTSLYHGFLHSWFAPRVGIMFWSCHYVLCVCIYWWLVMTRIPMVMFVWYATPTCDTSWDHMQPNWCIVLLINTVPMKY